MSGISERDRTSERTKLLAKKQRLETAIARAKLPLRELKSVPEPKFQTELVTLKQAQFNLDSIVRQINNFDQKFHHKDPWHVQIFESEKVQQQEQVNSLQLQLDKVNDELETLVSVYSPYRGKVRRVKILGQSDRNINVEVTLDVRGGQ